MPSYTETALSHRTPQERVQRTAEQERVLAICLAVRAELDAADAEYDGTEGAYVNPELIIGSGVVTPPSDARISRAYCSLRAGRATWADVSIRDAHNPPETLRQIATYGWSESPFGDADTEALRLAAETSARGCTVTVSDAEGNVTIRPVSEYSRVKRERRAAMRQARSQSVSEANAEADARLHAAIGADTAVADGTA